METPRLIPIPITAPTKEKLVIEMLKNNMKHGKHFKYFQINKDGNEWVAWYYGNAELMELTSGR